jgi:hypothetical protein
MSRVNIRESIMINIGYINPIENLGMPKMLFKLSLKVPSPLFK